MVLLQTNIYVYLFMERNSKTNDLYIFLIYKAKTGILKRNRT